MCIPFLDLVTIECVFELVEIGCEAREEIEDEARIDGLELGTQDVEGTESILSVELDDADKRYRCNRRRRR